MIRIGSKFVGASFVMAKGIYSQKCFKENLKKKFRMSKTKQITKLDIEKEKKKKGKKKRLEITAIRALCR